MGEMQASWKVLWKKGILFHAIVQSVSDWTDIKDTCLLCLYKALSHDPDSALS